MTSLAHAGVDADAARVARKGHTIGQTINVQGAGGRQKIVVRVFRANAGLDGVAGDFQLLLCQRQGLAARHAQLPLHQVLPGDRFGHGMLHLQPRVHLHEEKDHGTIGLLLDDEFDRASADVVDRPRCCHCRRAHLLAELFRDARCGGFFQHLLVTTLHRAVTLKQVHVVAQRVAEDLNLDVTRPLHVFLDQHRIVAKTVDGFALAGRQRRGKVFRLVHRPHALATAAGTGFDQHRVADAVGLALQQRRILVSTVVTRHQWHPRQIHQALGLGLEPHRLDAGRQRANEHQAGVSASLGKLDVFTQKAVAGMHRLSAGGLGGGDDFLPAQIAVFGCAATNVDRLVTHADVFGVGVGIGINRDGLDGQAAGGGGHAAGDFAPVGDENFVKHACVS